MIRNKMMAGVMSVVMAFTMAFALLPATVVDAAKGPAKGDESYAYICFFNDDGTDQTYLYISDFMKDMQKQQGVEANIRDVAGATYSKKTNTLTLNNYNKPGMYIGINMMGVMKDRIRVGNMLPAVLVPCVWMAAQGLFH